MANINSLPLVQIEGKSVLLNIPWVTQEELEKYQYQLIYAKKTGLISIHNFSNNWSQYWI